MIARSGQGTKIFKNGEGNVVIVPPNKADEFVPEEGMTEIHNVREATILFSVDSAVTAKIELYPDALDIILGHPVYGMRNNEGEMKEIQFIQFTDGSKFKPN